MEQKDVLVVFQDKAIRRTWFNEEWWFVATDIVAVLTDSKDPAGYLKDMRKRDEGFAQGWGQIATPLFDRYDRGGNICRAQQFFAKQKNVVCHGPVGM